RWDRVSNGIALAVSLESQLERPLLTIQERAVLVSSCAAAGRTSCMAGSAFEHVMAWSRAERGIPLISRPEGGAARCVRWSFSRPIRSRLATRNPRLRDYSDTRCQGRYTFLPRGCEKS